MTDTQAESTEPVAEPPPEGEGEQAEPEARRPVVALSVLAAVLFVGAVVLALVAANLSSDLRDERRARRQVEQTASRFADAFFTWDYQNLDATKARVIALSTGKLRREYEQAFSGMKELTTATKNRSAVAVKDVFSTQIEGGGASAIVVLDQTVEGSSGRRQALDLYVQLDLVRQGAGWRVDNLINLNFAEPLGAAQGTPDTTVPPPPSG